MEEESGESEKGVELDDLFPQIGEFGCYQKLLTWLVVLPACIPCGLQGFNQLFMGDEINASCSLPSILQQNSNLTHQQLKDLVLPENSRNASVNCYIKDLDWENISHLDYEDFVIEVENVHDLPLIPCPFGMDFSTTKTSIVADFDLVCGKEFYPTVALFLFNLGGLVGVFFFGIMTDLIGRKLSFFVCLTFEIVGGIGCTFAQDFWTWTGFRILVGLTVPAIYQIPFIICLELVGQNRRSFVTVMTCLFYVGGMMLLPLIAYFEKEWRMLSIWTTAPFLLYYLYFCILPESPRWLMAQGKTKEALEILQTVAKVNGTTLPAQLVEKITQRADETKRKRESRPRPGIKSLFQTPNLRLKTILLTFCWFANATVYVGLSFYGPSLGENSYLSFFLASLVEIPGYLLCWLLMDKLGRRWPLFLSMVIGGCFAIATVLLPSDSNVLLMTFYLIAKLGISASYLIVYPFGGELYPTEVRGVGLGFSAYVGGIGICGIPLINYLGHSNLLIPLIVMGAISVIGGFVALRLPETLNASLPNTIEEGEAFGKDFGWSDCIRCGGNIQISGDESPSASMEDGFRGQEERIRLRSMDEVYAPPETSPLRQSRRKKLVRQGSTLEAPTDSKGTIIITPWW